VASVSIAYAAQEYVPNGVVHPVFSTDSPGVQTYSTTSASTICSVNPTNGDITIAGVGNCDVRVDVAATTYYLANFAEATLVISKAHQAAVMITSASSVDYWSSLTPTAIGGSGTGTISFAVTGTCRLIGATLLPGDAGSLCQLTATRAGDANYLAESSQVQTIAVNQIAQAPLALANTSNMVVSDLNLFTVGGSGSGAVSYTVVSTGSAHCSVNGATLSATTAGTCSVRATKAASTNYTAVTSAIQNITVTKDDQTVAFTSTAPMYPVAFGSYSPTAVATSTLPVTFSVATSGLNPACEIDRTDATKINFLTSGDCDIVATQAGTARFALATAHQVIHIGALNQTIAFPVIADKTFGTPAFKVAATSNSGLPVSLTNTAASTAC
jgi:hypothetical protein